MSQSHPREESSVDGGSKGWYGLHEFVAPNLYISFVCKDFYLEFIMYFSIDNLKSWNPSNFLNSDCLGVLGSSWKQWPLYRIQAFIPTKHWILVNRGAGAENIIADYRLSINSQTQVTPSGTKGQLILINILNKKENSSFKHATIFIPDWWPIRYLIGYSNYLNIYMWLHPVKPSTFWLSSEDLSSESTLTLGIGIHLSIPQSIYTKSFWITQNILFFYETT